MKYVTDRHEIAQYMNFGKYPVLRIDLETPVKGWDDCYEGDFVNVQSQKYTDTPIRARLHKFSDDKDRYAIMPEPLVLSGDFGYGDVITGVHFAQAPLIHAGETVVLIEDFPKQHMCRVHIMKVSDHVGDFVYPTCYLEDIE